MPVEFLGMGATNDGTETRPRSGPAFDPEFTVALARAHEETGWDRVLTAYGSGSPDPAQGAALIACRTERLQVLVAHRPNVSYPTFAAKTVATLDQISNGRLTLHVITGGNDHEQQREGDTLPKDRRYDRTREAIQIFKKAWTSREPFDFHGEHYRFSDFVLDVEPVQKPRPRISFGGSSAAAYKVGAEEADIYALWGEPLAGTAEQIRTITELASAAGRPAPTFQVAFRPIRRTRARSGCWRWPSRVSGTTGRCGRSRRRRPAVPATPLRWSALPRRSPPRCWTTTTSACGSCPPAATTCSRTRKRSAA